MTPVLYYLSIHALPTTFTFNSVEGGNVTNTYAFICTAMGLWSGLVIGYFTEYYTSNAYSPVQKLANSCLTGAAPSNY
jgi:inorganic pyrophosphatase